MGGPLALDWDPREEGGGGAGGEGEVERIEWRVAHREQRKTEWCWAACVANALTAFGHFVDQAAIAHSYLLGGSTTTAGSLPADQRISDPDDVVAVWREAGFGRTGCVSRGLDGGELEEQLLGWGPVEAEIFEGDGSRASHLVLVVGLVGDGRRVVISDPASPTVQVAELSRLRESWPVPGGGAGSWQRSYVRLSHRLGYLRRFFRRPVDGLPDGEPGGAVRREELPSRLLDGGSPLRRWDPNYTWSQRGLRNELTLAVHGYRHFRRRVGRWVPTRHALFALESFPLLEPPPVLEESRPVVEQLRDAHRSRWHHQIWHRAADGGKIEPRLYALTEHVGEAAEGGPSWRARWLGEAWLAGRVERAIGELEEGWSGGAEPVAMVRWGGRNVHDFVTLWAMESDLHHVASVPRHLYRELRPGSRLSSGEIRRFARRAAR